MTGTHQPVTVTIAEPQGYDRKLSDEEIELRRQSRTGLKVERAVNQPGGRPAPTSAPAQGAKE